MTTCAPVDLRTRNGRDDWCFGVHTVGCLGRRRGTDGCISLLNLQDLTVSYRLVTDGTIISAATRTAATGGPAIAVVSSPRKEMPQVVLYEFKESKSLHLSQVRCAYEDGWAGPRAGAGYTRTYTSQPVAVGLATRLVVVATARASAAHGVGPVLPVYRLVTRVQHSGHRLGPAYGARTAHPRRRCVCVCVCVLVLRAFGCCVGSGSFWRS